MLSVGIFINGREIHRFDAVRIKTGKTINTYELQGGALLKHRYKDGAVVLAMKMLKRSLKNP